MTMSDPIADMLTRIRNANTAKHDTVDVPSSKMKLAIANILLDEGYIEKYDIVEDGVFKTIHITLKYGADKNEKVITGLRRISKPGLRVYANSADLPRVLGGLGTAIISTNHGVITDKEARKLGVGGEVLCYWPKDTGSSWCLIVFYNYSSVFVETDVRSIFTASTVYSTNNYSFNYIAFFNNAAWCCIFNSRNNNVSDTCISSC